MYAWIIAKGRTDQRYIVEELESSQYTVLVTSSREKPPAEAIDLCIDTSATGIRDVRTVLDALDGQAAHYILLSSCLVYPPVPRLSPWQEEMVDLDDAAGFPTLSLNRRRHRAAERELRHTGRAGIPWTILRPSFVENERRPARDGIPWVVSRVLDGGPIVLPDSDEPLFTHVSAADLAKAIRSVAGNEKAFFQTLNVTTPGFFSYDSYARRIMAAMNEGVPIVRVPAPLWFEAGLSLPLEDYRHSSFMADAPLLIELGWEPDQESRWLHRHVQSLVNNPPFEYRQRPIEHSLVEAVYGDSQRVEPAEAMSTWCITGQGGQPASVRLKRVAEPFETAVERYCTRYVAFGLAEEAFLTNPSSNATERVLGHNALLERSPQQASDSERSRLLLPVARRPCGSPGCDFCEEFVPGVSGVTEDGFGREFVNLASQHLIAVDEDLGVVALLADPLASLLSVVSPMLADIDGPVWVLGERIEALLAMLLVMHSGNSVLHVRRNELLPAHLPDGVKSRTIAQVRAEIRDGSISKAAMFINCSGARDGENVLGRGLAEGGIRITPYESTMPHRRRTDINYPLVSPGRLWLEKAIKLLGMWKDRHSLTDYLSAIPLAHPAEIFVPGPFEMRYLDIKG